MKLFLVLCFTLALSSCLLKKDTAEAPANNTTETSDQPAVDTVDHTDTVNTDPQFKPKSP